MERMTRPLFSLYVMWHPSYPGGREIADRLREHFRRDPNQSIAEDRGISVLERSAPVEGEPTPLPIDWDDAEFTAVVVLTEAMLIDDQAWVSYVRDIAQTAYKRGLSAGFFPVAMDRHGIELEIEQQALRWDTWNVPDANRTRRLISDLTHGFCRMLRHRLDQIRGNGGAEPDLGGYLKKIQVFISHSKHDGDGESVGRSIRDWVHENSPLDSFFDVHDIPPGQSFKDVLLHEIGAGAMVAVHTDTYSSREWCRREIIEAKRRLVPMIVVDCVRDIDPRGMPYLGNVPVVRMEPGQVKRIEIVAGRLLDEVFGTWLWLCRVGSYLTDWPEVVFTARPPELIALAALPASDEESAPTIVYPEPLLSADEEQLFRKIVPRVRVRTWRDWLEEHQ